MLMNRRAAMTLPAGLFGCGRSRGRTIRLGCVSANSLIQLPVTSAQALGYFREQGQSRVGRVSDLRGAIVGVTAPGSTLHMQLNYMLKRAGVESHEVSVVGFASSAARIAALESGRVDAAVMGDPSATLLQHRYPNLLVLWDTRTREGTLGAFGFDAYPGCVLIASDKWLGEHSDEARAIAASVLKAMRWLRETPAEGVAPRIPREYRIEDEHMYAECVRKLVPSLSPDGIMPAELPRRVRDVLATFDQKIRSANISLERTYTNQYVAAL